MEVDSEIAALRAENAALREELVPCRAYRAEAARLQREVDLLRLGAHASAAGSPRECRADAACGRTDEGRRDAS